MMEKRFRDDYTGEFVITSTVFRNGSKEQTREWVDNPITNTSINHRACCIDNGASIASFPMKRLENHRGGLLSRNKMQLYASGDMWKRMNSDFLVVLGNKQLDEIIEDGYQVDHVVYTSTSSCIAKPGEFYLIPFGVLLPTAALAVWLACFDGHNDIYLFGYDGVDSAGKEQQKLISAIQQIMKVYSDVQFHHVSNSNSPDAWRRRVNCERINRDTFVSECDI